MSQKHQLVIDQILRTQSDRAESAIGATVRQAARSLGLELSDQDGEVICDMILSEQRLNG